MEILDTVHPTLAERIRKVYFAMQVLGYPMRPTEGLRTLERQQQLYAQGRTAPGSIVTRADGIVSRSNHQACPGENFGRAVDSCFVGSDPYLEHHVFGPRLWEAFGANAVALGLIWGGRFTTIKDRPHVEYL